MSTPRVLGYDDLHGYLEEKIADDDSLQAECLSEDDHRGANVHAGRVAAFREVLEHIEAELEFGRG